MKYRFILLLLFSVRCVAQKPDDSIIFVTLQDTTDMYKQVKKALVNADFIVRDNYNPDTLTTYLREFTNMSGNCTIMAVISGNKVTLRGFYSLRKQTWYHYMRLSKKFIKITYFKGSRSWRLMMRVAEELGGEISYGKE